MAVAPRMINRLHNHETMLHRSRGSLFPIDNVTIENNRFTTLSSTVKYGFRELDVLKLAKRGSNCDNDLKIGVA